MFNRKYIYICAFCISIHAPFSSNRHGWPSPLLRPSSGYLCWRSVVRPVTKSHGKPIHGPVLDEKVFFYLLYITYIYHKHQPNVYCKYTSPIYPMVSYTISLGTISWWVNSMLRVDIESWSPDPNLSFYLWRVMRKDCNSFTSPKTLTGHIWFRVFDVQILIE